MIYRKMDHDGGTGTNGPKASITVQESATKKPKLSHKMEHRPEESSLLPGPRVNPYMGGDFLRRTWRYWTPS